MKRIRLFTKKNYKIDKCHLFAENPEGFSKLLMFL